VHKRSQDSSFKLRSDRSDLTSSQLTQPGRYDYPDGFSPGCNAKNTTSNFLEDLLNLNSRSKRLNITFESELGATVCYI